MIAPKTSYQIKLIGIGMGEMAHLTQAAIKHLSQLSAVVLTLKSEESQDLLICREQLLSALAPNARRLYVKDVKRQSSGNYRENVKIWHQKRSELWREALLKHDPNAGPIGILCWGEPTLYDSALRLFQQLQKTLAIEIEIISAISSLQLLCARHLISMNTLSGAIYITTARQWREQGLPNGITRFFVMLDTHLQFLSLKNAPWYIYWGAYLGSAHEIVHAGLLSEVAEQIQRSHQRARAQYGWIMETYLLEHR